MKDNISKLLNRLLPIISVLCVLAVWAISAVIVGKEYILPTISQTFACLVELFGQVKFYLALAGTILRTLIAFVLSFSIASFTAIFSVKSKTFRSIISPIIGILRALPTVAVILLLLVWTNSKIAPVIVTMLVVLPTTHSHLKSALEAVDRTIAEAGRVDGATEKQVFGYIELPLIKPALYSTVGSGFSLNFKLMVAAEVLSSTARSIGNMLNGANYNAETAEMIALVVVSVTIGLIVECAFNRLANKLSI